MPQSSNTRRYCIVWMVVLFLCTLSAEEGLQKIRNPDSSSYPGDRKLSQAHSVVKSHITQFCPSDQEAVLTIRTVEYIVWCVV